jgi:hypothetical protein
MQDQDQEMRDEAAKVHEEVQEELQEGRQEETAAVREDLLQARLSRISRWHTFAAPARRSCA